MPLKLKALADHLSSETGRTVTFAADESERTVGAGHDRIQAALIRA
jgi:hypothetical protein